MFYMFLSPHITTEHATDQTFTRFEKIEIVNCFFFSVLQECSTRKTYRFETTRNSLQAVKLKEHHTGKLGRFFVMLRF